MRAQIFPVTVQRRDPEGVQGHSVGWRALTESCEEAKERGSEAVMREKRQTCTDISRAGRKDKGRERYSAARPDRTVSGGMDREVSDKSRETVERQGHMKRQKAQGDK